MKKRIVAAILAVFLGAQPVFASVLGDVATSWSHDIASGTSFYKNTFNSNQASVGMQAEYYAEYSPNENVVPTVVMGNTIWGLRNITAAEKYMKDNGMVPLVGINASYFSWKTGVPMGHILSDGKIMSKDTETYQSIGFRADGTAFMAPLSITTTLTSGEQNIDIAHINKYNQTVTDVINLYTDDFEENNHTEGASLNLILGDVDGELKIGDALTATVEEKFNYTGAIKIPEGKMVLTINEVGRPELYNALNAINIGDSVTISNSCPIDGRWAEAVSGLGSVGETLIKNGAVQTGFAAGAAPRTAVGITENGNILFYVIDGRQKPYSYGAQLKTLANRLKELGCVDAINLDGGGSTTISGVYPGADESAILNSPSEGSLRTCSSYIFLKNVQQATGVATHIYAYPFEQNYLSGYSEQLYPELVDSAYYKMTNPEKFNYSVDGTESTVSEDGVLNARGNGDFTVNMSYGEASGSAKYHTFSKPTNVDVYNANKNSIIKSLSLNRGDSIDLRLESQYYYLELKSTLNCYKLEVTNNLGYVDEDGTLTITANGGSGALKISVGDYSEEIPISVGFETPFADISSHWARNMIQSVYEKNIISGYSTDAGLYFKPDNNITREEFAVIMCKYLNVDTAAYENSALDFADKNTISAWARPAVSAMFEKGIITGKQNGDTVDFAPAAQLTRAEAMTILGRTIEEQSEDEYTFADSAKIPDWAKTYINTLVSKGYVNGYEDDTIKPDSSVTRAEAVTMLSKML